MARTNDRRSFGSRLVRGLLALAVLVALAWTGLWFAAASWIEGEFDSRTAQLAREGRADVECGRRDTSGFPFTMRFQCDGGVMIDADEAEIAFSSLQAHATVLSPGTIHAKVDGPANVVAGATTAVADWTNADLVVENAFGERAATLTLADLALDLPRLDLAAGEGRLRLAPDGFDLDLDFTASDATLSPMGREAVSVSELFADVTFERMHRRLLVRLQPFDPRQGLSGRIARLGLATEGEGRLLVSGPFTVSPEGLISGDFTIAVRDGAAVAARLSAFADDPVRVSGALVGLETLGTPRTIDGVEMRAIELTAVDGKLPLGLVTIDLPRVWGR